MSPARRRAGRAPILLLLSAAACAGPDGAVGTGLDGPDVPLAWTVAPVAVVGGAEAADETAFGDVGGVAFDAEGRLYVLDVDARRVVVVDSAGAVVGTRGAPGDGPGELASAAGLVVAPDGRVTVLDAARRRFVVFEPDGSTGATVPLADSLPLPSGPLAAHPDGWIVGSRDPGLGEPGQVSPPTRALVLHPGDAAVEVRVAHRGWRPPVPEGRPLTDEETGGMRVRLPPLVGFHPDLLAAPLADGRLAVVDSVAWRIERVHADGSNDAPLVRPIEPRTVTTEIREAERSQRLDALGADAPRLVRSGADGSRAEVANDAVRRLQQARIDAMGFHDRVPVIDALRVDPAGRLWVARTPVPPSDEAPIDVVTPDGGYVGTLPAGAIPLPAAFGPGGLVAHIERDDFGAPVIRIGRLLETPP